MSGLDVNPHIPGCIATGGTDKVVKVWNLTEDTDLQKRQVSLVTSRDLGVVRHFTILVALKRFPDIRIGQGFLSLLVAGRRSHSRRRWLKSQTANLGCRRQRWRKEGTWTQDQSCRSRAQGKGKWWSHRCCI